jgi:hypothetical protein
MERFVYEIETKVDFGEEMRQLVVTMGSRGFDGVQLHAAIDHAEREMLTLSVSYLYDIHYSTRVYLRRLQIPFRSSQR